MAGNAVLSFKVSETSDAAFEGKQSFFGRQIEQLGQFGVDPTEGDANGSADSGIFA